MIVRAERGRLRLALQTDHAMLAGEFAAAWGGGEFMQPVPLAPVRLAAEIHDDGWADWEREPSLVPGTGRPHDFLSLQPDQHIAIYERSIREAVEQHPYTGLLVSLHGAGLYLRRYGHMPELHFKEHPPAYRAAIDRYLTEQKALQTKLTEDLKPDTDTLWTHYRWLQAWDLLSLYLCLIDPAEGAARSLGTMPLRPGGPEVRLVLQGAGPGRFTLDPWPFHADRLDLHLPVRYLPARAYASDAEFRELFLAAPTEALPLTVQKLAG